MNENSKLSTNDFYNTSLFGEPDGGFPPPRPARPATTQRPPKQSNSANTLMDVILQVASPVKVHTKIVLMQNIPHLEPDKASTMIQSIPVVTHRGIPAAEAQRIVSEFASIGALATQQVHDAGLQQNSPEEEQRRNLTAATDRIIQQLREIQYAWDISSKEELTPILTLPFNLVKNLQMAADDGDAACSFVLGMQYFWGIGRRRSEEEAVEWFNRAATAGLADAQNALGLCYTEGTGIQEDKKAAARWYTKAAEQGDLYAMHNLGLCYMLGTGVKTNVAQAEKWLQKALQHGSDLAHTPLGILYKVSEAEDMIPLAIHHFTKAAEFGNPIAMCELAEYYINGIGVEQNTDEAFRLLNTAAELGHGQAFMVMAECYENGIGVPCNLEYALHYYQQAANDELLEEALEGIRRCRQKQAGIPDSALPPIPTQADALPPIPQQFQMPPPVPPATPNAYSYNDDTQQLNAQLRELVVNTIATGLGINYKLVTPNARLVEDLGADELDLIELQFALEEATGVSFADGEKFITVKDYYLKLKHYFNL